MRWVFWGSAGFIAYTYVGYPSWLYLRTRWHARPVRRGPELPSVSIVMAVYNEARILPDKLRNLCELDYPAERHEIIVVSDGSTDRTSGILAESDGVGVKVLLSASHRGKACALNLGIQAARGEIIVFTDARQLIDKAAIKQLVASFADPSVGCVSGDLILGFGGGVASGGRGLGLYWKLEKKIREWEGATGSVVGATGALYAVRRELLVPLPAGTILDDVYLPLMVVRQGRRVVFEPRARAYDDVTRPRREFKRKVRTLTGNYQLLRLAPWLLTQPNPIRFQFVSHKLFRLWVPAALAVNLGSALLLKGAFYQFLTGGEFLICGLALTALFRARLGILTQLADIALAFFVLNAAAVLALFYFLKGDKEVWTS